jgi:hypothetical protein
VNPDPSLVPDNPIVRGGNGSNGGGGSSASTALAPAQTAGLQRTVDGNCGAGFTCLGSRFGNCCSTNGFCGKSADYCGSTCQPAFGACSDSPR